MPPPAGQEVSDRIPRSLVVPHDWDADLTVRQLFFAGAELVFDGVPARPTYKTSTSDGSVTLPA